MVESALTSSSDPIQCAARIGPLPRWKKAAFAGVLFSVLFVLAELTARAVDAWTYVSIGELRQVYQQRRGWRLGESWPMQRGDYPYLPYVLNPQYPGINALGFRGPPIERDKPADTFRIVCLGGSTTFNGYPAYLEAVLRDDLAALGLDVQVINAGNQQWTTMDSLVNFITRCLPLEPDAVVVYHAVNDAIFSFGDNITPDYAHVRKRFEHDAPLFWDYLPAFLDHSAAFVGFRAIFERKVGQRGIPITVTREHDHPAERRYNGMDPFRNNLRTLIAVARDRNVSVFLCTQVFNRDYPFRSRLQRRWGDAVGDANDIVRSLATERDGVYLIDAAGALTGGNDWMTDYVHFTEDGKQRLARFIADGIRGLLPEMVRGRSVASAVERDKP